MEALVIGGGASGTACAAGLLAQGHLVTIIDAGVGFEEMIYQREENFTSLSAQNQNSFILTSESIETLKSEVHPRKLFFGSPLSDNFSGSNVPGSLIGAQRSLVLGGLTNIWGATMLPLKKEDGANIKDFLVSTLDIEKVISSLDIPVSSQINNFCKTNRIYTMPLAISNSKCKLSGFCLSGCPNNAIWSSRVSLLKMMENKDLTIKASLRVVGVEEINERVKVSIVGHDGKISFMECDQLFLAAGPISTFEILANSNLVPNSIKLVDSAMTIVPMISLRHLIFSKTPKRALTSDFIRFRYGGSKVAFAQLYPPSNFLAPKIRFFANRILKNKRFGLFVFRFISVAMIYQAGVDSKSIKIEAMKTQNGLENSLIFSPQGFNRKIRLPIVTRMEFLKKGLLPFMSLKKIAPAGTGIHYGSTLPTVNVSKPFTTDSMGLLNGCNRINVVDGSILPEIPAGPITLSLMANSFKIGNSFKKE